MSVITGNLGTLINAITLIVIIVLIFVMGLKPALRAILEAPPPRAAALPGMDPAYPAFAGNDAGGMLGMPPMIAEFGGAAAALRCRAGLRKSCSRTTPRRLAS